MARPRVPDHLKIKTPCRQIGKVKDPTWDDIQAGYQLSDDLTFTGYAVKVLLRETKRLQNQQIKKTSGRSK